MNLRAKIAVAAGVLLLAGCRELPRYFAGDTTIARAGGKDLRLGDVRSVVPQGLSGDDSAAFMKVYIDRWVLKQLKLQNEVSTITTDDGQEISGKTAWSTWFDKLYESVHPKINPAPQPLPYAIVEVTQDSGAEGAPEGE